MIPLDEYKMQIGRMGETLAEIRSALNPDAVSAEIATLEETMGADGFWDDVERGNKLNQQISVLRNKLDGYMKLQRDFDDLETLLEMAEEEQDDGLAEEVGTETERISERIEAMQLTQMLKGPYDGCNAVLSLHAGAGGTEAQDWTEMLYRMYTRYCERRAWTVRELDMLDGDDAGVKSVTFEVDGENAYGYLKAEKGVHRLVRISPFDASGRRHTSFSSLDVTPILDESANSLKIDPDELRVDTYRSSGAGGQHVNKTSSAIRITHLPTGIVVQCQNERSQIQNRETAMRMLRGKLLELQEREREEHMAAIKGEMKKIEWGSQIRSYVFQPYTLVKDHRTNWENGNIQAVMDGDLDPFIREYLIRT